MNIRASEIICDSRVIRDLLDRETLLLIDYLFWGVFINA